MAGWGAASIPLRVALIVLCLALVVFVIGFATKGWAHNKFGTDIIAEAMRIPVYVEHELGLWAYDVCYTERGGGLNKYLRYAGYYQCGDRDIGLFIDGLRCGGKIGF